MLYSNRLHTPCSCATVAIVASVILDLSMIPQAGAQPSSSALKSIHPPLLTSSAMQCSRD